MFHRFPSCCLLQILVPLLALAEDADQQVDDFNNIVGNQAFCGHLSSGAS